MRAEVATTKRRERRRTQGGGGKFSQAVHAPPAPVHVHTHLLNSWIAPRLQGSRERLLGA